MIPKDLYPDSYYFRTGQTRKEHDKSALIGLASRNTRLADECLRKSQMYQKMSDEIEKKLKAVEKKFWPGFQREWWRLARESIVILNRWGYYNMLTSRLLEEADDYNRRA